MIAVNDDSDDPEVWDDDLQAGSSQVQWTAGHTGEVFVLVYPYDEEIAGSYRLEIYSTTSENKGEVLAAMPLLPAAADEMFVAVDDELYSNEEDWDEDVWDDSDQLQDWNEDEEWEDEEAYEE